MKCLPQCVSFWFFSIQLLKKHTLNPEITLLIQFLAQKTLFKFTKICNINFWIENDPPWKFFENSSNLAQPSFPKECQPKERGRDALQKWTMWVNLFFATNCPHVFVWTFQLDLLMSISCHGQGFSGQVRWVSLFVREKLRSVSSLHGHPLLPLLFLLLLHSATTTTLGMPDNTQS